MLDTANDTIPDFFGLPEGTLVTYIGNSNDPDTNASRAIGGLLQDHVYVLQTPTA